MTRIAYVLDEGHFPDDRAVAGRNWARTFAALGEKGVEPFCLTLRDGGLFSSLVRSHVSALESLGCRRHVTVPLRVISVRRILRRWEPDLIHAHEVLPALVSGLAGVGSRVPLIFHRHHTETSGIHALLSRVSGSLADRTVAVSSAGARCAERLDRTDSDDVLVAFNGAAQPVTLKSAPRDAFDLPPDARLIVCVARLREEKGHAVLLKAFKQVRSEFPDSRLVLLGGGPERAALARLIRRLDLSGVLMLGHRDDVADWLMEADVVAVPSFREALPLAVVEAMSLEKALVASAVGGLAEVLDSTTAILVPPGDDDALAEALLTLLRDPQRRAALGSRVRSSYLRSFTVEAMADRWIGIYRDLL